ncbi:calmodulin-like protein 12 [Eurytemora carolleeae]|uniref:calmodulin-like protein 12 n=1 Tax=Eurytemora carolleeae TaxID=1294199 RepID=UPI000C79185A|nr:calmodulin-like protein 12 [Eurytemora carolleeae]|eukprot:XP_023328336.1 calmodulin-like protein 12 [Eurytemora affinis]
MDSDMISNIKSQFKALDLNGDGRITLSELINAMGSTGADAGMAEQIFYSLDKDGDDSVYWEEFLDSFVSASEQAPSVENKQNKGNDGISEHVLKAFVAFDTNRDGRITVSELMQGLEQIGLDINSTRIQAMFSTLDVDGSGFLDYKEFAKLL